MAGKVKPLDVERKVRPGKSPDGDGSTSSLQALLLFDWIADGA